MSLLILNIGGTGTGKTTLTIDIAKNLPVQGIIVNDVQREVKYSNEKSFKRYLGGDIDGYIKKLETLRAHACIVEESTMFFSHAASNKKIVALILSKRFSQNVYILNFHAFQQIPIYIMNYVDYIYVKKTNENPLNIQKKFDNYPHLIQAYNEVMADPNKYEYRQVKMGF